MTIADHTALLFVISIASAGRSAEAKPRPTDEPLKWKPGRAPTGVRNDPWGTCLQCRESNLDCRCTIASALVRASWWLHVRDRPEISWVNGLPDLEDAGTICVLMEVAEARLGQVDVWAWPGPREWWTVNGSGGPTQGKALAQALLQPRRSP